MEKRSIQIDIDTARKWYLSRDSFKQELALQVFTKEELKEPELPKSWDEFKRQILDRDGCLSSRYYKYSHIVDILEHLLILRDVYRQGWKPDWKNDNKGKWVIFFDENELKIIVRFSVGHLFSFPTEELAEQFLENFKTELEQLKELL